MTVLLMAAAILAGLAAPAPAKDQWVIAAGDEPNTLSPLIKGVIATASETVHYHLYDADHVAVLPPPRREVPQRRSADGRRRQVHHRLPGR
jgi:hypothetical protein